MNVLVNPARLSGKVDAISSKSYVHRLLICAALADRETNIKIKGMSEDILATIHCLKAMGCGIDSNLKVTPINEPADTSVVLNCGESGSTARFLLPLVSYLFDSFTLTGEGKLPSRPFSPLCRALEKAGCSFSGDRLPLDGRGKIKAGDFYIEGDISSQFISGLLFVLPLLDGDSRIVLTSPLESAAYVDITIEVLKLFGINAEPFDHGFKVKGNQSYRSPGEVTAEGDWSNMAFFLCMGALGGSVKVSGLSKHSAQGDKGVIDVLKRFGVETVFTEDLSSATGSVSAETAFEMRGTEIDASPIPDLIPVLSVVASVSSGKTRIFNAKRLRLKESDRIESTYNMLSSLGADISITEDGLLIRGKEKLNGGTVDAAGDHRIVMSAAVAASVCENPVKIIGAEAVNKSYPSFFEDLKSIGGSCDVV